MWNPALKQYIAETAIGANLIVKFGSTDDYAVLAAAAADKLMGVSGNIAGGAGERVDIIKSGIAYVVAGGTITRGDALTSDASGRAVTAAPALGVNNRIIGIAEASAVVTDIFPMLISPGSIQGT